ncbi:hypothetical protein KUTeg_021293 [Tegillarca granosa]|uniref:glycerophosphocholine cholinephosphodiesterase n=1 Tax=Tegillarca granosa TaxID=220873 RepID=A0ABQ9EEM9_TEGGR|nr:hypothetical protein KUTeg_021293 [Tegillarca granosa]
MYRWRGCEIMIEGRNATYCKLYNGIPPVSDLGENIDEAVLKMKSGNADLVVQIDRHIQHLLTSLEQQGLKDDVNVIIVSDHGMTEISPSRVINLTTEINMNDVDVILDRGPTVNIWPKEGKIQKSITLSQKRY